MTLDFQIMEKEIQLQRVAVARKEQELEVLKRLSDVERLKKSIDISKNRESELEKEIEELKKK